MAFELQPLVERYECRYFAENEAGDGDNLNLALQSPFIRLYALNRNAAALDRQRLRFQGNERIQLFHRTHDAAWFELVRIVPSDQPSVFWIHAVENVGRCLTTVARLRPQREDVLVFEPGHYRGIMQMVESHFGRTHRMSQISQYDRDALWDPNPLSWSKEIVEDQYYVIFPRAAGR